MLPLWARRWAVLALLATLWGFCSGDVSTKKQTSAVVVGTGDCSDCMHQNINTADAFSGLFVGIYCKAANGGEFKIRGWSAELSKDGNFQVKLPNELVDRDGKLTEECYAQMHSASQDPCPAINGLEQSKIVFKSEEKGERTFSTAGKLSFTPLTCTSAFLWPHFKPHPKPFLFDPKFKKPLPPILIHKKPLHLLPKHPLLPKFSPMQEKSLPQIPQVEHFFKDPLHPIPKFHPIHKKPLPSIPKIPPIYKKPIPPVPTIPPIYKKPIPPVPTIPPIYKKPIPPVPTIPPIYKKPLPPVPITHPIYKKPLPSVPKIPPVYKKPIPPVLTVPPIYKKPLPPVPKTHPIYKKPLPPVPKIPPILKKPLPTIPKIPPVPKIPPLYKKPFPTVPKIPPINKPLPKLPKFPPIYKKPFPKFPPIYKKPHPYFGGGHPFPPNFPSKQASQKP